MSALTILTLGLVLILVNSAVTTVRLLIHIGMAKSLITTAVKKTSTSTAVQSGFDNQVARAYLEGYFNELARLANLRAGH